MNFALARTLADAVMMEGYALYPYRASATKNRFRWTFGVLAPRAWSEAGNCEPWWLETQLLVAADAPEVPPSIAGQLRFFQIERRSTDDGTWDEGIARTLAFDASRDELFFAIEGSRTEEPTVRRDRASLCGRIAIRCEQVAAEQTLHRFTIRIENTTPWGDITAPRRAAIASALASTHLIVGVAGGKLLSATDPPEWARHAAHACTNTHTFPVLVGAPGSADVMLCAPFVLYDHAQLAPESTGDLCDGTEIDELLVLRTRTLTDAEKREARETDPRTREIIDRSEGLPPEWLERLHGATRDVRGGEMVARAGEIAIGRKVRLRAPAAGERRRTDAQDALYAGQLATVVDIRHDVDGTLFLAVTIDADPAAELHDWYGRYHYYRPDEVDLA